LAFFFFRKHENYLLRLTLKPQREMVECVPVSW
jgi:hypothetical protein